MVYWKEAGVRGGQGGVGRIRVGVGQGVTFTYGEARSILAHLGHPWEDDTGQHTTDKGSKTLYAIAVALDLIVPVADRDEAVRTITRDMDSFDAFQSALLLGAPLATEEDREAMRQMLIPAKGPTS